MRPRWCFVLHSALACLILDPLSSLLSSKTAQVVGMLVLVELAQACAGIAIRMQWRAGQPLVKLHSLDKGTSMLSILMAQQGVPANSSPWSSSLILCTTLSELAMHSLEHWICRIASFTDFPPTPVSDHCQRTGRSKTLVRGAKHLDRLHARYLEAYVQF